MVVIQQKQVDVGGAIMASLLNEIIDWGDESSLVEEVFEGDLVVKAIDPEPFHEGDVYDDGTSGVQLLEVYRRAFRPDDEVPDEGQLEVPGIARMDTFPKTAWFAFDSGIKPFKVIPFDETWFYNPSLLGIVIFGAVELTKEMKMLRVPITFDCTRDNVVKNRPVTMSETQAYKLLPKWRGRCSLFEAASRLWHLHADTSHLPETEEDGEDENDFPFETRDHDNG